MTLNEMSDVKANGSLPAISSSSSQVTTDSLDKEAMCPKEKKMMTNLTKRPPVEIEFKNVSYKVQECGGIRKIFALKAKNSKTILKEVSGQFKSGDIVAIMGPSGAGKSTLMNILAGYKTSQVSGQIFINGKKRNLRKFRKMSCYIMQDDCLSPHLTVDEAMAVAANLKLGEKVTKEQREKTVGEIIQNIGLSDCLNTRTNMISGGQRKRLAIALELVNNPPVMFLDEPTSGLDSYSCFQCISLLRQLAREGRTIICTIHQPSAKIFEMFDKLYVLSDGQTIYDGAVRDLVPRLASLSLECPSYHNPADFVMEVAIGEHGQNTEKLVKAAADAKCHPLIEDESQMSSGNSPQVSANGGVEIAIEISSPQLQVPETEAQGSLLGSVESIDDHCKSFPTSTWTQFRVLFVRTFLSIIRDQTLTKLRLLSHILIGFLLGMLYYDVGNEASKTFNNSAMLFFCMLFCMFTAMMPTVMTFPLEMSTFKREHLNYWYSMKSYYLAKVMADMPFQIVYPLIYVVIVYFLTSQPMEASRFGMFALMCILTSLVAQSLGLVIGCACDIQSAVYLGPITTIPILLFSGTVITNKIIAGFFVSLNNIPTSMQWLSYVAYVRYGFEGTMLAIYGFDRQPLACSIPYCHFKHPMKFLEELALDQGIFWIDVVSLIVFFVFLRIIGYFVLRYKLRNER